jgi:hypothetical protein
MPEAEIEEREGDSSASSVELRPLEAAPYTTSSLRLRSLGRVETVAYSGRRRAGGLRVRRPACSTCTGGGTDGGDLVARKPARPLRVKGSKDAR